MAKAGYEGRAKFTSIGVQFRLDWQTKPPGPSHTDIIATAIHA
jgi:hypothetical protein